MPGTTTVQQRLLCLVVTYNSADHVGELLDSVGPAAGDIPVDIVVVDNESHDRTTTVAACHPARPRVVRSGGNLGYSGGINVGRRHLQAGQDIAILNPDLELHPGALATLVAAVHQPGVGIAVPALYESDGRRPPHLRREPTVLGAVGDSLFGSRWPRRPSLLTEFLRRDSDYQHGSDVDWASGAMFVIGSACNEAVGPWDDGRYFLYAEETDYARRARDAGFAIRYVPQARATHHGGGSGTTPQLTALMSVNRIRYFEQHHGRVATFSYQVAVLVQHALRVYKPDHRLALTVVASRRRWSSLPSGDRPGATETLPHESHA